LRVNTQTVVTAIVIQAIYLNYATLHYNLVIYKLQLRCYGYVCGIMIYENH